jgi:hypothetical protein
MRRGEIAFAGRANPSEIVECVKAGGIGRRGPAVREAHLPRHPRESAGPEPPSGSNRATVGALAGLFSRFRGNDE